MGVINVTPDSFSDGGVAFVPADAVERALAMEAAGADLLDIGAESTRPGAQPVDADEEWSRLEPVLAQLARQLRIPISIDTYKSSVAQRALDAGAAIINDISGLEYDAALGSVVADREAALVLMHTRGTSAAMYAQARYEDVVVDVTTELERSIERAVECGVARERLIADPGLGFAKRAEHSLSVVAHLDHFASLGLPILVGPSRKSFLTAATGLLPAPDRDWATAAAVTACIMAGAHIVRVHRIAEMVQVARVADAIRNALTGPQ